MTRYCDEKVIRVDKSLEQEVVRQRDVAELKTHVLKTKLVSTKLTCKQVRYLVTQHGRCAKLSQALTNLRQRCMMLSRSCPVW